MNSVTLNLPMKDNEIATVSSNPTTNSVPGRLPFANPFNFDVSNPNAALLEVIVTQGRNPTFTVRPKVRFFGADRVVSLTMHAQTQNNGPTINGLVVVTVQGTDPDDGLLDHFEPSSTPPVPQS